MFFHVLTHGWCVLFIVHVCKSLYTAPWYCQNMRNVGFLCVWKTQIYGSSPHFRITAYQSLRILWAGLILISMLRMIIWMISDTSVLVIYFPFNTREKFGTIINTCRYKIIITFYVKRSFVGEKNYSKGFNFVLCCHYHQLMLIYLPISRLQSTSQKSADTSVRLMSLCIPTCELPGYPQSHPFFSS